jgi:hypothetical protein
MSFMLVESFSLLALSATRQKAQWPSLLRARRQKNLLKATRS